MVTLYALHPFLLCRCALFATPEAIEDVQVAGLFCMQRKASKKKDLAYSHFEVKILDM